MSEPSKTQGNRDSVTDAHAAFALILLVVATAVFWVSHQQKPISTAQKSQAAEAQHQFHDPGQQQHKYQGEEQIQHDEMHGLVVAEVTGAVSPALHAEGGSHHAVQYLPEGRRPPTRFFRLDTRQ